MIQKGIILAGGTGSRLKPITDIINKHLIPIYNQPLIYYPIQTLLQTGIKDILIITSESSAGQFVSFLKDGSHLGLSSLQYAFQSAPNGIAGALSLAQSFSNSQPIAVLLGDNTTNANLSLPISSFSQGAHIFLKAVPDPARFGNPSFSQDKISHIFEKPPHPRSPFAVTGIYLFDQQVFSFIQQISPSNRNELEITDVLNLYLNQSQLSHSFLPNSTFWSDAGTFESLYQSSQFWRSQCQT